MDQNIKPKSINEITSLTFFIPSYQRGYRWEKSQVKDLLDDIYDFINSSQKKSDFYCLQPIIVKKHNDVYKVIDGQQRLTTIFLILSFLKKKRFSLEFETRSKSKTFLENLSPDINHDNIDFFYISHAYHTIMNWFDEKASTEPTISEDFYVNLGKNTNFIWYEIGSNEPEIEVFTRINSGKIPLTEAELVKALFLNRKNFEKDESLLHQIEIAKEWDEIESSLQNDEFWFFLTKNHDIATRIQLILEIFSNAKSPKSNTTYQFFNSAKDIVRLWSSSDENIKKVFLSLRYWFEDRELYHLIGYLVAIGKYSTSELYQSFKAKTKIEFKTSLYVQISLIVGDKDFTQKDYYNNYGEIFNILLLFNIVTIMKNSDSIVRFSFEKFNKEKWSIEHIHAQQDHSFNQKDRVLNWLKDVKLQMEKLTHLDSEKGVKKIDLLEQISNMIVQEYKFNDNQVQDMQKKVFAFFGDEPNINTIDNLALLPQKVNSALGNSIFPTKRDLVIHKDKQGEFVPMCTKNVFLKYYSKNVDNLYFWTSADRKEYLEEIKRVLENISK